MAREASIELDILRGCEDIVNLVDLFCNGGWNVYNEKGIIEYLPVGDDDNFSWQYNNISYTEVKNILSVKQQKKELVGIHLFYKCTLFGISLLAKDVHKVSISISINRKTIDEKRDSLTDFDWYFSKIILMLYRNESILLSYKFHDYID